MNASINVPQVDVSQWHFDPLSVQSKNTICLQKSLDDCKGFVVIDYRTNKIVKAKNSWMVGLFAIPTAEQIEAHEGEAA